MFGPLDLIVPPTVLLTAVLTLPFTIASRILTGNFSDLTVWPKLKHLWFKHFWWWFGPASKPLFASSVRPLLAEASGIVLDIGPASGIWMPEFGEAVKKNPGKIKKIYGIEPNTLFHPQLLSQAKANGLAHIYEPVAAYAEELEGKGIAKGSIDTVITVHVLCSVGDHADTVVKELYDYLKPGGQWLVYEHVVSRHTAVKAFQAINNVFWPTLLDGCTLDRDTEQMLRNAGQWDSIAIGPDPKDGYFETLPHTIGRLVK
ncbi:uncharacterized protein LTR77_006570 [Saxophila tyrrhenica]|uniref:S-adenosyl-L-methionine-dependent methyltransferase n=1 Tax=Saxophila tyrrhenica TaxID=1690608 RepID=A0AAV9P5N8_9PEZI|nr:hypothetical protein LTR77_006570 [Saxophila tyrrhenica]